MSELPDGLRLKFERIKRGLRQYKVAVAADLAPAILNQIENGKREARPDELRRICAALGVSEAEVRDGGE